MQMLDLQTLWATLDRFSIGVAIVGDNGRVLHVNDVARGMLDDGANIRTCNGRLCGATREATDELGQAIRVAWSGGAATGAAGIGVPLPGSDGHLATAHVLPLAPCGEARAAVFVTHAASHAPPDLTAIARSYRLTPMELRLLDCLCRGETLVEAAASLKIAVSTARSHLKHLFAKTETLRQAQLIALVHRLVPPVRCGAGQRRVS